MNKTAYNKTIAGKSMIFRLLILTTAFFLISGCVYTPDPHFEDNPSEYKLGPWTIEQVRSTESGEIYNYLHLKSQKENAPKLLLLHGITLNMFMYTNAYDLAEEFEVYSFDRPLESSFYSNSMKDFSIILDDFTSSLGINDFIIGGVSYGGVVASNYFIYGEQKPLGLIMMSSVMPNINEEEVNKFTASGRFSYGMSDNLVMWYIQKKMNDFLKENSSVEPYRNTGYIYQVRPIEYYRQSIGAQMNLENISPADYIDVPMLILHGGADKTANPKAALLMKELIPDAELKILDDYAHDMVYKHGPEISAAILEWYRENYD